jgi:hypothetical protein
MRDPGDMKTRNAEENCALSRYYAASSGNSLPTFRDNLWYQNVYKELPLLAA